MNATLFTSSPDWSASESGAMTHVPMHVRDSCLTWRDSPGLQASDTSQTHKSPKCESSSKDPVRSPLLVLSGRGLTVTNSCVAHAFGGIRRRRQLPYPPSLGGPASEGDRPMKRPPALAKAVRSFRLGYTWRQTSPKGIGFLQHPHPVALVGGETLSASTGSLHQAPVESPRQKVTALAPRAAGAGHRRRPRAHNSNSAAGPWQAFSVGSNASRPGAAAF